MSFQEFADVVKHIAQHNAPGGNHYPLPTIKYIDPVFDMRTNTVFAVTFRAFGSAETQFHTQNECRDLPLSLKQRVMEYLTTPLESSDK
jgi:hypothetical protein